MQKGQLEKQGEGLKAFDEKQGVVTQHMLVQHGLVPSLGTKRRVALDMAIQLQKS